MGMNMRSQGNYRRYQGNGGMEIKFADRYFEQTLGAAVANTPEEYSFKLLKSICDIPQNASANGRIGKKITLTKLNLRFECIPVELYSDARVLNFRLLVVQDTQCNGQSADIGQILSIGALPRNVAIPIPNAVPDEKPPPPTICFNEMSYINRFRILLDKRFACTCSSFSATVNGNSTSWNMYRLTKSLKLNVPIEFNISDATGSVDNIRTNNIAVYLVTDTKHTAPGNLAIGSDGWLVTQYARIRLLTRTRYRDL